tara:strand:+ start:575 stop:919 length:345 start_codon:yes stop_codon:yes gene_type:complete
VDAEGAHEGVERGGAFFDEQVSGLCSAGFGVGVNEDGVAGGLPDGEVRGAIACVVEGGVALLEGVAFGTAEEVVGFGGGEDIIEELEMVGDGVRGAFVGGGHENELAPAGFLLF